MAFTTVAPPVKPKESGGGGLGGLIGGVLGVAAAPFTGGASLAGLAAGAGLGNLVGGAVGSAVKPGEPGSQMSGPSPIERRAQNLGGTSGDYVSQSPALKDSLIALQQAPDHIREAYKDPLMDAYAMSLKNDMQRGVRG